MFIKCFRNISVVLESQDLSADLEAEGLGEQGDPTAPSAKTFHKIAKYYERKGDFLKANESIGEAEKLVHIRHPDYHLLTTKVKF